MHLWLNASNIMGYTHMMTLDLKNAFSCMQAVFDLQYAWEHEKYGW